jgi:hypothetical protein
MTAAAYGGGAELVKKTQAPGRLAIFQSNSSLAPEEYLEKGSMWHHFEAHGVPFFNFGEGFEFAGTSKDEGMEPSGGRTIVNIPMPAVLFQNTSREYPSFNTRIPDQYRAEVFLRTFEQRWASGKEPLPRFIFLYLPNDHGDRPRFGYPFLHSYMADNDLALGRIVEALSRSPFWKEMAIFVTEDDAQSGVDHVDAHRSLCYLISPWARRGQVSHRQASIASVTKSVYRILGLPDLHLYDAAANDLSDLFASQPDLEPWTPLPVDRRIFDPALLKDPADPDYQAARRGERLELDGTEEAMRQVRGVR